MRKTLTYPFVALIIFLMAWVNLPKSSVDQIRSAAVKSFVPSKAVEGNGETARLVLENQQLRAQLDHACEWIHSEKRTQEYFKEILRTQIASIPAQVIYRDPSSWSSSLWVNVGEESNKALGRSIIAKNSPVLSHGALVGVVDYVGAKQARIRLITDSGVTPAVQIHRGSRELARQADEFSRQIEKRTDLFTSEGEKGQFLATLAQLRQKCGAPWEDGYLAKGEVHGSSAPFWRSRSPMLKGIGFHFDEMEGVKSSALMLKEGDLLVTSGLDGVFPQGLKVGTVFRIETQREGAYTYDLEVRPAAVNLNDLQMLNILPPLE